MRVLCSVWTASHRFDATGRSVRLYSFLRFFFRFFYFVRCVNLHLYIHQRLVYPRARGHRFLNNNNTCIHWRFDTTTNGIYIGMFDWDCACGRADDSFCCVRTFTMWISFNYLSLPYCWLRQCGPHSTPIDVRCAYERQSTSTGSRVLLHNCCKYDMRTWECECVLFICI